MILKLAWRNIWRNRRRTAVILTAIVIGLWAMVFLSALMRGIADRMVKNAISTMTGHIKIYHAGYRNDPVIENRIENPGEIKNILQSLPAVRQFTSRIRVNAVAANARHSGGVTLVGIHPGREAGISFTGDAVTEGEYLKDEESQGILVGRALLEKYETRIGHKLVLMSRDASGEIASRAFRIRGIYDAELESTERQFVFVNLAAAQEMLGVNGDVTEFSLLIDDYEEAAAVAASVGRRFDGDDLAVYSWKELLPLVVAVLKMYDGFILFWFAAVFIAIAFGLVNTILMAVFERIREFGLMRALGMKPSFVVAEVSAESFFLLFIGTVAGNLLGAASVAALSQRGIDLSAFAKGIEFAGMSRIIFPVLELGDILTADAAVLVLGMAVGLYPAIRAARFSPVEAMVHM
ncbi:MAG: ABC transporter permease [Syntrophales bacterium]|jgi:ABC-type lipoprotein release transport system permease subunit|nr:ABC transporter permease [Syntrophales bacterium]